MSTYLGRGLAVPHARLDGLERPVLAFGRSVAGIPLPDSDERAEIIFLLLTPSRMARIQPRLLADIAGLLDSEYVTDRLRKAPDAQQVIDAIRAAQEVVLD
jgi:mannitol/fructose-specific phosphotransferase system IIA component (Ntr-type)